ncbi:hypothetical protein [Amycolatopsis cihanbeyliensis]|uniref:Uncharacterized protein n=1 Tax=Amycolatopsis cihanbeyliensis TaxID=1128664 RepID=A0A542DKT5_AMYCI|nr:hypothetical protein [Amycolatopsis cihanbeyliensis]TQJ03712.1 hypothetical protein FB471_3479 [Amycolatopsis cihanbeyliensis]
MPFTRVLAPIATVACVAGLVLGCAQHPAQQVSPATQTITKTPEATGVVRVP